MDDLRRIEEKGPRPRSQRPSRWPLVVALVVMLATVAVLLVHRAMQERAVRPAVAPPPVPAVQAQALEPLPPAAETDRQVRALAGALSSEQALAAWLLSEDLVRRFVAAVNSIAGGQSPRLHLDFMAPRVVFAVHSKSGHTYIDPESFARYNHVTRVFASIDARQAARVHAELAPLFARAQQELGASNRTWEQTLTRAMAHLVYAPMPIGRVEVIQRRVLWELVDERLEALSPAQKHLVRMGPKNAAVVQAKLRELATALELPVLKDDAVIPIAAPPR